MLHKPLAFRDIGYSKFQTFLIAFLGIFVSKLTFYAFCLYHFSIACGLLKPPLLYFCNPSVVSVSFHLLLLCLLCLDISGRRNRTNFTHPYQAGGGGGCSGARMTKLTSVEYLLIKNLQTICKHTSQDMPIFGMWLQWKIPYSL